MNGVKFSGKHGNSSRQPQPSTTSVEVPPVFDTSLTYADARGRRLFDNMKKEDTLRKGSHSHSTPNGGKGAKGVHSMSSEKGSGGLSRSGKLLVQSLAASRSGTGAGENKQDGSNGGTANAFMRGTISSSGGTLPPAPPMAFASSAQWLLSFRAELQVVIDSDKVRNLTLHECRESIAAIYESKAAADSRALNRGSGGHTMTNATTVYHSDTMEMHVYRTLEKKYGLRSLAVDHAAMLLMAVRLYKDTETDIDLFYKIFRNDVEEEFRLVQNELKKSVIDLMTVHLMNK